MKETLVEDTTEATASSKFKVTALLGGLCGIAGATAGVALTYLGNVISGYPISPSLGIYVSNSLIMAGVGASVGPPLAWSLLRTVPIWRVVVETAAGGLLAGIISMLFLPSFFVAAIPLGVVAAALRLRSAHAGPDLEEVGSARDHRSLSEPPGDVD